MTKTGPEVLEIFKSVFKPSEADLCGCTGKKLNLVPPFHPGVVAVADEDELETFGKNMEPEFKITSKGANYFLGLKITQYKEHIKISQYAKKILRLQPNLIAHVQEF
ncbi:unnamed protein product [Hermetia illucens]|uniref:Uncharacterized protein n=1 Tax=Hermetia illucens TaxID=343691 RepID=A0A7R8URD9_HERIL|nr:unnamed protein product [Hermetia illucens]